MGRFRRINDITRRRTCACGARRIDKLLLGVRIGRRDLWRGTHAVVCGRVVWRADWMGGMRVGGGPVVVVWWVVVVGGCSLCVGVHHLHHGWGREHRLWCYWDGWSWIAGLGRVHDPRGGDGHGRDGVF
jgi:hypothetical protein